MDADTEQLTAELADEIQANDQADGYIAPQSIPTRFSLLKTMRLSPAHYRAACQRPQDDSLAARLSSLATDRKEALRFGSGVHGMLLGQPVAVYTGGRRDQRVKEYREFMADCAARNVVAILSPAENHRAVKIVSAIQRNKEAMRLLCDGTIREQRIDWTYAGKPCRSTPDARNKTWCADLKTAVSAEPETFRRAGLRLGYHCQAALYADAIEAETGSRPDDLYVIAVEKTEPYPVTIMRFMESALEIGARQLRAWVERLIICEATDEWPEYIDGIGAFDFELELDGRLLS